MSLIGSFMANVERGGHERSPGDVVSSGLVLLGKFLVELPACGYVAVVDFAASLGFASLDEGRE